MRVLKFTVTLIAILGLLCSNIVTAQGNAFLNIYRDPAGQLTPASRNAVDEMVKIARSTGHITLWLTLNFEYNLYLNENTDQVAIEAQEHAVRDGFDEVLIPLIAKGAVWHPKDGQFVRRSGCYVRATVGGLKRLIRDDRILQIVAVE